MSEMRNEMHQAAHRQAEVMTATGDKLSDLAYQQDELQAALAQAEANYKTAWADAMKAGWTSTQLRSFGFKQPSGQTRRRPRKRSAPQPVPQVEESQETFSG